MRIEQQLLAAKARRLRWIQPGIDRLVVRANERSGRMAPARHTVYLEQEVKAVQADMLARQVTVVGE